MKVVDGWDSAYDGDFTQGGGKGTHPLVVSYASSPPAAVYFAEAAADDVTGRHDARLVLPPGRVRGRAEGHRAPAAARKLVDFMLSDEFQADIPLQMFVFPVRDGTPLPAVFEKFAEVATDPLTLPPADIAQHRDEWIDQWTNTVLR